MLVVPREHFSRPGLFKADIVCVETHSSFRSKQWKEERSPGEDVEMRTLPAALEALALVAAELAGGDALRFF